MKVGVDATSWANRRGFGRFARNAVGRLVELDRETEYVFFIDEQSADSAMLPPGRRERRAAEGAACGRRRRRIEPYDRRPAQADARRAGPARRVPLSSVYTYFPVLGTPTVVGLHDTIVESLPELTVPSRRERAAARLKHSVAVRRASGSSPSRRPHGRRSQRTSRSRPSGCGSSPRRRIPCSRRGRATARRRPGRSRAADGDRFFLYAGGISPHKNVETLIDAYARARADGRATSRCSCSSATSRARPTSPPRRRCASGSPATGWRTASTFPASSPTRCSRASTAAPPASSPLAEGFGLLAVEAAACGAAVALSDLPPHRETLGTAALLPPDRRRGARDDSPLLERGRDAAERRRNPRARRSPASPGTPPPQSCGR